MAVGFRGGFTIYYLQDDPFLPVASYRTIRAGTDVVLEGEYLSFENYSSPFTHWPCDLVRVAGRVNHHSAL